ncbi:MAG: hypothetical protein ACRD2L_13465, partial [Terriglobia bacterium]
ITTYAWKAQNPTPSQVLLSISISVFAFVLSLWMLDAVSILRMRSAAVSRSVYGLAVASILTTSVGVYKGAFEDRKYPFEGLWEISVRSNNDNSVLAEQSVLLMHSESGGAYWGFSDAKLPGSAAQPTSVWLEVVKFNAEKDPIRIDLLDAAGKKTVITAKMKSEDQGKRVESADGSSYQILLTRPTRIRN